jgi:hypothetical protein
MRIQWVVLIGFMLIAQPAGAQNVPSPAPTAAPSRMTPEELKAAEEAIIKASQNPLGNIAIIPFQSNWNYGSGLYDRTQYNLNFQPVVPIEITPKLTLVERTIVPLLNQPSPFGPVQCATAGCPWTFGVGDIQEELFFAPKVKAGDIICGAGPIFYFPPATPGSLGYGKTSVGPNAVALIMPGPFVIGMLANQAWSVMGRSSASNVSVFVSQPFVNYNFGNGWALSTAPLITANWNASGSNKWTVPMGMGITKTFKLGDQRQQLSLAYYANVVRPLGSPAGTYRISWNLLFPVNRH